MPAAKGTRTWLVFAACAIAVIAALGWTTAALLRLEHAERGARNEVERQQRMRVALWRMEALIAPRLAEEAARPYFHYAAFYAPQRAYTRMLWPVEPGEVLVPSPLLTFSDPFFKLHFQVDSAGVVTSPQVPEGNLRDLAEAAYTTSESVVAAAERLAEFRKTADGSFASVAPALAVDNVGRREEVAEKLRNKAELLSNSSNDQQAQLALEWSSRAGNVLMSQQRAIEQQAASPSQTKTTDSSVSVSPFTPLWSGPAGKRQLFLVRHVKVPPSQLTQGVWTDWPAIRDALVSSVADILPGAEVTPAEQPETCDPGTLLAGIPAVLSAGRFGAAPPPLVTSLRAILGLSWAVVLTAIICVGAVLQAAVELGRRRGEFVSAVTHELRTPLTTFRMYSEMLAEGMVSGQKERQEYLATLRDESDHLARLVENVLTYARIEQGRAMPSRRERITVGELIERAVQRPADRARRAGVQFDIVIGNGCGAAADALTGAAEVVTDTGAVEQILSNLIDNAIKYACPAEPSVMLAVMRRSEAGRDEICIGVSDKGPGIAPDDGERIFRAFTRGSETRKSVVQGVGLGLAISRRLARNLGGDLRLRPKADGDGTGTGNAAGATFVLMLPVASDADA